MEKSLSDLSKLQSQISEEYTNYKWAIIEGKEFHVVKTIYMHIKELEKELDKVASRIHEKLEEKSQRSQIM